MVFLTLSKKLSQILGPILLRDGIKLRSRLAGGVFTSSRMADAVALLPIAQKLIELDVYEACKSKSVPDRVALLESYIRPAILPNEKWSDIAKWQFHAHLLKWLRTQYLIARHPVPHLPSSLQLSPQIRPATASSNSNATMLEQLPLTTTVTRSLKMSSSWSILKNSTAQRAGSMQRVVDMVEGVRLVQLRGGAVCFATTNTTDDPDLSHLPLSHVLELAGCHVSTCGPWNTLCEELNIYQLWTKEYVEGLGKYLGQQCRRHHNKKSVIFDVGAGDGVLAAALRDYFAATANDDDDITVMASDNGSWKIAPQTTVHKWTVQHTMVRIEEDYNDTQVIVLCSWMPMYEDWTKQFRSTGAVDEYILIGECDDGQCGDNWETWGNYAALSSSTEDEDSHTSKNDEPPPMYEEDGYKRTELTHLAPFQLSRFDCSVSKSGRTISFQRQD